MAARHTRIPDLVGFGWSEAREIAERAGLKPHAVGPDGQTVNGQGGVVIDQTPAAGETVPRGIDVALRVAFGGGPAGDSEPRDPLPQPHELEDWLNMPSGPDIPHREKADDREPALTGAP